MKNMPRILSTLFAIVLIFPSYSIGREGERFSGKWVLIPEKSAEIGLYKTLSLNVRIEGEQVTLSQVWGGGRSFTDILKLKMDGSENKFPITNRVFPSNVFMGLSKSVGKDRIIKARWEKGGQVLQVEEIYPLIGSQGVSKISVIHTYELSAGGTELIYDIKRSTRKTGPEVRFVFRREGYRQAYFMKLGENWEIHGKLPEQAFLISLQGVTNSDGPHLYFIYPKDWSFTYTGSVFDFYKDKKDYLFKELGTPAQALRTFRNHLKGYVVWDRSVRTSLIVAFTIAGLERSVVVSEDMIPMVEKAGLRPVEDLRGRFEGKSDVEIYQWAYDKYWSRCSRDFIIWMGGEHGRVMKPGVADWGIYNKAFFSDLSTRVTDTEEYALADKLLGEMNPMSMVMGWHSYAKDLEREHVKLVSSHGHRVEGLHTLPNLSFSSQVPPTPGFQFKNKHNVVPGKTYIPKKKVYLACIQTDGLGIGAWLKPGRGEIPYAWEVIMNYHWLAPAMMEYFYTMATPNDYFIGALSGPGYIYPKAVPRDKLSPLIEKAREMMEVLDLKVFEIMDYSEGATVEGNTELTREVVEAYYKGMPDALGFVNGYAPAYTFTVKDGKPLISYDYYLSPTRTEKDVLADLYELAEINKKRPYFCLIHVREYSNVKRVKNILDQLGPEFELVPLDVFLKMAGNNPTFRERFLR